MSSLTRVDLHVHSTYSPDSSLTLDRLVERMAFAGLRGAALTDHNTVRGHRALENLARAHPEYWFIPGVEISTREGHLLAYGISSDPPVGRPIEETIEWIHDLGGIAALAHPYRWTHGAGRRAGNRAAVDLVETVNGHNTPVANARAELLSAARSLPSTGGSDSHEPRDLGRAYSEFPDDVRTARDLLEALRRGTVRGSGNSLGIPGQIRWSLRTSLLRAARGFRSI
ncbi:MAG: PHP domain-containing protein [Thermoplasmata archaeon]